MVLLDYVELFPFWERRHLGVMIFATVTTGTMVATGALIVGIVGLVSSACFLLAHLGPRIDALEQSERESHTRTTERLYTLEEAITTFRCQVIAAQNEIRRLGRVLATRLN